MHQIKPRRNVNKKTSLICVKYQFILSFSQVAMEVVHCHSHNYENIKIKFQTENFLSDISWKTVGITMQSVDFYDNT